MGGYVTRRHDALKNYLQQKAAIVYNDTEIEPHLQVTETQALQQRVNPQDKSRSDIRINGFNREFQNSFLDVKVINIQAKSHEKHSVAKALEQAEDEKTENTRQGSKMLKTVRSTQLYSLQKEEGQENALWWLGSLFQRLQ